jgi:hypothetical protein
VKRGGPSGLRRPVGGASPERDDKTYVEKPGTAGVMRRRSLLTAVAAAVGAGLAGCAGESDPAGDDGPSTDVTGTETDPTRTRTETGTGTNAGRSTPTRTGTTTPTATRPAACPTSLGLDVERPDPLTADSVESFVVAYEEAYLRAERIPEGADDAFADAVDPSATPHGAGFAVEVRSRHGWCDRAPVDGDGDRATPTETCVDGRTTVVYYVDRAVVRRTRERPDRPREGELLECA